MREPEDQLATTEAEGTELAAQACYISAPGGIKIHLSPKTGVIVPPAKTSAEIGAWIDRLTKAMLSNPDTHNDFQLKHTFLNGMYMREMFIPEGTLVVGKMHKMDCLNIVSKGDVCILTELGSARLSEGFTSASPAGIQKVAYAHEDTVFVNVFRTDAIDQSTIEDVVAFADRSAADQWDYGRFLDEFGLTEELVRPVVEDMSDHIDMPPEFIKFTRAPSEIHGDGIFAAVDIAPGELVAPARIGRCRTVVGRITNHAMRPNCELIELPDGGMDMIAVRSVFAGEELTVDYRQAAHANTALGLIERKDTP